MEDKKKKRHGEPVEPRVISSEAPAESGNDWELKASEYLEGWKRAKADLENFEKREHDLSADRVKYANKELIRDLLPVLDNYDRAFDSLSEAERGNNWVKGFEYIKSQLETVVKNAGAEKFTSVGAKFDPAHHESVAAVPGEKDIVAEEVVAGYEMGGKVIRHAKVKVGNGEK